MKTMNHLQPLAALVAVFTQRLLIRVNDFDDTLTALTNGESGEKDRKRGATHERSNILKGMGNQNLATVFLYCVVALQMQAATLYVDLTGSHTAPYTNWATAANNIQAAVDAAASGDTVLVTNGTYLLTAEILVTNNITLESVNGPDVTIVDGGGTSDPTWNRCFNLGTSACIISGFTVSNGLKNNDGGGIYCLNSTPVATNCTISGNQASPLAGVRGGGMYYGTANNCTFTGNAAYQGGGKAFGIANNCMFTGNTARRAGGGMLAGTANNCTISANTADGLAGGGGGGIFGTTVNNCVVWYNFSPLNNDIYLGTQNYTCSPDVTNGVAGNITNAPVFVDKDNGNYRLAFGSPCINEGTNGYVVGATDLDGASRIVDTTVDMGAYEYDALTADSDGDGMTDGWEDLYFGSATGAVASANADVDPSNNGDEFIAGTDPTNAASFFAITTVAPMGAGFELQWDAVTGRLYSVNWTDSLTNSFQALEINIAYPQNTYTDTVHAAEAQGFYHMEVELAE